MLTEFKSLSLFFKPILLFVLFRLNVNYDQGSYFCQNFFCFSVWTKLIRQNYWKINFQNRTKKCLNMVTNYSLVVPNRAFRPLFIHLNSQKEYYFFKIWRICMLYSLINKVANNRKSQVSPFSFQTVDLNSFIMWTDKKLLLKKKGEIAERLGQSESYERIKAIRDRITKCVLECNSIMKLLWLTQISFII